VLALVLNAISMKQFLIASKRQVAMIKSSVRNAVKLSKFASNWTDHWCVKLYITNLYSYF